MKTEKLAFILILLLKSWAWGVPGSQEKQVECDGLVRRYRLYLPSKPERAPALVLALHGGGGTPLQMEQFSRFSQLAEREGFVVLYPEGIDKGWNDGREGKFNRATREKIDDVAFIRHIVNDTVSAHGVDRSRIFVTGMSNGGFLSSLLGAKASDLFCAIAPVAGGMSTSWGRSPLQLAYPVSVLIIQGTADPLVPYGEGAVQAFGQIRGHKLSTEQAVECWKLANGIRQPGDVKALPDRATDDGCQVSRVEYTGGRSGTEVVLCQVNGGGHTWPGSSHYLPRRLIGNVCRDFDATEEIWQFFKAHPRPREGNSAAP